ncbi:MAG: methylmalonyl-CoA epimerase [SAR202 cluster bacterium]|jgi:methylmalonyl-CoA epimerase|nr:methylmalonyl-CoA epimerase [SAR202 cluster bacterium]
MTEPLCVIQNLNHVCLAVNDIEETLDFYQEMFGIDRPEVKYLEDQAVLATLVAIGGSQLEFIQPTDPDSGVAKFINNRGEGMHHICFEVENLSEKLKVFAGAGVKLIDQIPRDGLSGQIAFIHPKSTRGVLVELVDKSSTVRDKKC